jgi:hypothetical protein
MYFPSNLEEVLNFPLKTQFMEIFQLQFGQGVLLTCKKVITTMDQMVMLFKANDTKSKRIYNVAYQILKSAEAPDRCEVKYLAYVDQSVLDIAIVDNKCVQLLQSEPTFGLDYSVDFHIEPNFKSSITAQNCEEIISTVSQDWKDFLNKFTTAFKTQFVFDVLECVNSHLATENKRVDQAFFNAID